MRGAARARAMADNPQSFLPASQFGITLIGILTGVFGGEQLADRLAGPLSHVPVIAPYASPAALVLTVLVITFLTLVFGELVPKQLALRHPERVAAIIAQPAGASWRRYRHRWCGCWVRRRRWSCGPSGRRAPTGGR